jgi:histone deacetylase complex regulatory component SIN3
MTDQDFDPSVEGKEKQEPVASSSQIVLRESRRMTLQFPPTATKQPRVNLTDAKQFVEFVKKKFESDKARYNAFVANLRLYNARRR